MKHCSSSEGSLLNLNAMRIARFMFQGPETISRNPKSASRAFIHFPLECRLSCPRLKQKIIKGFLYVELIFNNASSQQHRQKGESITLHHPPPVSTAEISPKSLGLCANSESPTMYFRLFPAPDAPRFWDLRPSETSSLRSTQQRAIKIFQWPPSSPTHCLAPVYLPKSPHWIEFGPCVTQKMTSGTAFALRLWTRSYVPLTKVRPRYDDHDSPTALNLIHIIQLSAVPYFKRPILVFRPCSTSRRQLTTSSSSKPAFQPAKIQTALLPSQDGSKGVVEYALYSLLRPNLVQN